jgi:hypothetical protein
MFQDAWFWRLKPQRKQPWTTAAILLVFMAKKVVWNNYCKLTQTAASTVAEPVEAHQTVGRCAISVRFVARSVGMAFAPMRIGSV